MRHRGIWSVAVALLAILLIKYLLLAIVFVVALPFVFVINLLGRSSDLPTFPWNLGEILVPAWASPGEGKGPLAVLVGILYARLYYWVVFTPRRIPLPASVLDLGGRVLSAIAASLKAIPVPRRIQGAASSGAGGFRAVQVTTQRSALEFFALVVFGLFIIKYLLVAAASAVALPFMLLLGLVSNSIRTMPWNEMVPAWLIAGGYIALWQWRRVGKFAPPWLGGLVGRFLDGDATEVVPVAMERFGGKDKLAVPTGPSAVHNEAVEQLMQDLLAYQPANQGWLAEVASSFREQARTGRLQANLERIVAILEQEKKRLQHLTEINKLSGQLGQAGLAADVEGKRIALERLKLEHEAQRLAAEMDELLGLKVKERYLKEKEIELRVAQVERELEELRRKPEPPAPQREQETPEEYAARRADMLIKYAVEIKRIRSSVDDSELAEDLVDRFLVDIRKREDH